MREICGLGLVVFMFLTACATPMLTPPEQEPPPSQQPEAGWSATLSTRSHGVSGTVTVVDEDTIRLDDFFYDGGGLSVFVYLGGNDTNAAFVAGLPIGPELFGTVFSGESLTIDLPEGESISDYRAVAIWCVDASVSFGSGAFASP